jgi:cyclase
MAKTLPIRIIPRLDIKGHNLVKGIHLEGLRVLGKPEIFSDYYYNQGADELLFMDVVASLYQRNSLHDIISKVAKKIFIPLTVGGGIRTIDDIHSVLRAGADKVSLNTAAIQNIDFVKESVKVFGSSTIVISIEAIKNEHGTYYAFTDNGREETGKEVVNWAKQVESVGVGEILITSVDNEGTGDGFDYELINSISQEVKIPIIAHGGAQKKEDIQHLFQNTTVRSACISSILHYDAITNIPINPSINFEDEGNVEFLKSQKQFHRFQVCKIADIKNQEFNNDLLVRKL